MAKNPKRNRLVEPKATFAEHEEASLAYLIDLIISDPQFAIGAELKSLINHPAAQWEDIDALSKVVAKHSEDLHMPPRILAYAVIQWFSESDKSPSTIKGSANWILEAPHIGFDRRDLIERFDQIHRQVVVGLSTGRDDPEECLDRCIELNRQLESTLKTGRSNLNNLKGRRKQLFYAMSKINLQAFYLSEIRGLNLDSPRIQELLAEANVAYDLRLNDDRQAAQRQIYDWSRTVRELIKTVDEDLGVS